MDAAWEPERLSEMPRQDLSNNHNLDNCQYDGGVSTVSCEVFSTDFERVVGDCCLSTCQTSALAALAALACLEHGLRLCQRAGLVRAEQPDLRVLLRRGGAT